MNAVTATSAADQTRPKILISVPDGMGGFRNELRPAPPEKPKARKKKHVPDPIKANPDNSAQALKKLLEEREALEAEKAELAEQIKDVNAEVKLLGFNLKIFNRIIANRKLDPRELREEEEIYESYTSSLGIEA